MASAITGASGIGGTAVIADERMTLSRYWCDWYWN